MVKKFLILALFLPILVSCKDNKRIIESNSSEILSKENKKSDNNISKEDSDKEESNLPEKNVDEIKDEVKQNLALIYINFEGENTYYLLVNNKTNAVFIEGIE